MEVEFEASGGEWREKKVEDFFEVLNGKRLTKGEIVSGNIPYISSSSVNNGIQEYISNKDDLAMYENCLSIAYNGKESAVFYHPYLAFFSDNVRIVRYKDKRAEKYQYLFTANLFKKIREHFNYGNPMSSNKLRMEKIILPFLDGELAFSYMEDYIKVLEAERIETLEAYLLVSGFKDYELTKEEEDALEVFDTQEWQDFRMGDLFDRVKTKKLPYKAKELPKEPQGEYSLPALTSSFMNQGLNYYVPKEGATVLQNIISIPSNSDVYRAYFQSQEFTVLSDAYAIDWIGSDRPLRPNDYLFIVPSINKVTDLPIYSYKNKLGGWNVVKDKMIKLPVNERGEIHFDYMVTLVQAIKKLAIKDVILYADKQIEATKEVVQKGGK
ncbi:TPA: restriction endonuclease subunit S [Streptococcus pyogenes]|uniref:restriction endonuclease subunit S n=1 Tax=Streptococcus pyogenes TaxID=1314 RepID=UPI0010A12236|nr:restriction endonuclease subunit S [Streptococcus pyogenes]VHG14179.1 restriction enzyme BgcI subunit beta [Streptococcus pyogenes]VHH57933.1 restriction enzyme BgcI subunit beta [Streptococcus pyogenes]VHH61108.1 restriction enzyme BgcI subunit beta [Streptococcus pyogenes]VHH77248.1 restriction enzyme BgcI subunit beta [Streptococcus pyogenes]HEP1290476.1 restriction endonuclease subunit S [Streptococcus pyogenes]